MKLFKIFFISKIFLIFCFLNLSFGSIKNNIIAKVGEEIITSFDLENKIKITLILARQEINQENINKVKSNSMNYLINLKVKSNELKKYKFKKNPFVINQHLEKISSNLNIEINALKPMFKSYGIDYDSFIDEINTEFLWQQLITQIYIKKISIDEDQIISELNSVIENNKNIVEYNLAEIDIDINNLEKKDKIISEILSNIKQVGFDKTAVKFSMSSSSMSGGKLGWISANSLSKNIFEVVTKLNVGEVSDPIIQRNKILFLKILEKREIKNDQKFDKEKYKAFLIDRKKNELLDLYSNSHLSKKRNSTLIEFKQ